MRIEGAVSCKKDLLVKNVGNKIFEFIVMVDNSQYSTFLGWVSLDVGSYIRWERDLRSGCDFEMKGVNMMTCFICAVCDWSRVRGERGWFHGDFVIAETQGGGFVLCEGVGRRS